MYDSTVLRAMSECSSDLKVACILSGSVSAPMQDASTSMQIGAVPLKEYYSAEKKNHFYKVWNDPDKEKDYVFQRNIGYVYYGRPNPWKQADVITAKIERMDSPRIITFNLKVKDGNNRYRNLSYSETFNSGSQYIENE